MVRHACPRIEQMSDDERALLEQAAWSFFNSELDDAQGSSFDTPHLVRKSYANALPFVEVFAEYKTSGVIPDVDRKATGGTATCPNVPVDHIANRIEAGLSCGSAYALELGRARRDDGVPFEEIAKELNGLLHFIDREALFTLHEAGVEVSDGDDWTGDSLALWVEAHDTNNE